MVGTATSKKRALFGKLLSQVAKLDLHQLGSAGTHTTRLGLEGGLKGMMVSGAMVTGGWLQSTVAA